MSGAVVMDGALDLHPRLLLGRLPFLKATNTSLEGEAPPRQMLAVAAAQLMGAKSLV